MGANTQNWHLDLSYDQWTAIPVSSSRPAARYKHAAAVVGEKLYITGGSRNGRYLSDVQVLDLRDLAWSTLKLNTETGATMNKENFRLEVIPPISGHSMIKWGNRLLLIAGHSKVGPDSVTVRFINLESHECGIVETSGKVPVARSGQSVSLVGSKLIMFGGEDKRRHLLNDVYVLDLETMTWSIVDTMQAPPSPRFDHTATVHAERYLLVFGGCSHSVFFNDLHVLDLETMEWSQPQIQGEQVTPRAGHAGVAIDENWFIVGGGDNKNGAPETLALNTSKLSASVLTSVKGRDPLASEGLSLSSALLDGDNYLIAFGGYNGKYNNEIFVLRPKPRDSLQPKIFLSPAAAAAAASVTAAYALAKADKIDFSEKEDSNFKEVKIDGSRHNFSVEIDGIREEKKFLESSFADVKAENSALRAKIEDLNGTYAELSKELHSVQGQLTAERSRCAKLEAQTMELQKRLESLQSIEEQVQALRSQKAAVERDLELAAAVPRQGSGGVWRWIAG